MPWSRAIADGVRRSSSQCSAALVSLSPFASCRTSWVRNVRAHLTRLLKPRVALFTTRDVLRMSCVIAAAFVNFTSISNAVRARDAMHAKHIGPREGASKPLLINFTSAQQNCSRARGARQYRTGDEKKRGERRILDGAREREPPERSRALYLGSVPDAAGLKEVAELIEPLAIIESLRVVRAKSCAFVNLCNEQVAEALHVKFTLNNSEAAPLILGKQLTVNFAKARPCTNEQIMQIERGARRHLRVLAPAGFGPQQLRMAMGARADTVLVEITQMPLTTSEAEAHARVEIPLNDASAEHVATSTMGIAPAHALCASFSSIMAATVMKEELEGAPHSMLCSYVANPVLSESELESMLTAARHPNSRAVESPTVEHSSVDAGTETIDSVANALRVAELEPGRTA